jgi:seryl-tRNA synthetase
MALFRTNKTEMAELIRRKDPLFDIELVCDLDQKVRAIRVEIEQLQHKKNELAQVAKKGVSEQIREQSIAIGAEIKQKQELLDQYEVQFMELYLKVPNIPDESIPLGGKESNRVVKMVGSIPQFSFSIENHVTLGQKLGWLDFQAAAKMTAGNFAFYKGEGVRLLYALGMFMLKNNQKHGYEPVLPPVLVNEQS